MSVRNLGGRFLWRLALPGVVALVPTLLPRAVFAADPCASSSDPLFHGACSAGQAITGLPADAANAAAGATAYVAKWALTKWVVDAAVWLLGQLGNVVFNSASPVLSADWFRAHYADMVAVAWVVAPLFLLLGVVQAIVRADLGVFGRIAAQLVVVAIFTLSAVAIAQMLVGSVDELSDFVSRNVQNDLRDFLTKLPLMEAGVMHHAATPFQSGWHRFRTEGWRRGRQQFNSRTRTSGSGTLPIAGRRPAAGAGAGAGAARGAAGAAATGGVAAAVGVATAGAKAAGRRAAGGGQGPVGGGQPRRPGGPGGPGAPAGWRTVRVAGGGSIHVPGGWVRNARPAGSGSRMRTPGANGGWMFTGRAPSTRPPGA
jgi:hypothetical protein